MQTNKTVSAEIAESGCIIVEDDFDNMEGYVVVFRDDGGESILSRQLTLAAAQRRARHFTRELAAKRLLVPDALD